MPMQPSPSADTSSSPSRRCSMPARYPRDYGLRACSRNMPGIRRSRRRHDVVPGYSSSARTLRPARATALTTWPRRQKRSCFSCVAGAPSSSKCVQPRHRAFARVDEIEPAAPQLLRKLLDVGLHPQDRGVALAADVECLLRDVDGCHDGAQGSELDRLLARAALEVQDTLAVQVGE